MLPNFTENTACEKDINPTIIKNALNTLEKRYGSRKIWSRIFFQTWFCNTVRRNNRKYCHMVAIRIIPPTYVYARSQSILYVTVKYICVCGWERENSITVLGGPKQVCRSVKTFLKKWCFSRAQKNKQLLICCKEETEEEHGKYLE